MTITVHAEPPAQRLIGPGRKKPGPKPGTRRAKPSQPTPVASRLRKVADKLKAARATTPSAPDGEFARRCRQCKKLGTSQPLGDGRAKCSSCGHTWTLRRSKFEAVSPAPRRRPTAQANAGDCTRCDHLLSRHVEFTGACLVPGCVCAEAVA